MKEVKEFGNTGAIHPPFENGGLLAPKHIKHDNGILLKTDEVAGLPDVLIDEIHTLGNGSKRKKLILPPSELFVSKMWRKGN